MAKIYVNPEVKCGKINREIYGHFAEHIGRCIYEGIFVGEDSAIPNVKGIRKDVVEALKEMQIPVLRWPGGCFADEYHWRDGIGPKEKRRKMVNTNWGGVIEDNSFGTHEFMELCEQLDCKCYINGNVGSGTVREMAEWVEYMSFDGESTMAELRRKNGREKPWKVDYFAVGNEPWGCGGNMRPQFYADEYRRYQTYIKNYPGQSVYRIACGADCTDYEWTEVLMRNAAQFMDGLSLHYYTFPSGTFFGKGNATKFSKEEYYTTLKRTSFMEELIQRHGGIMDRYDPEKKVGMIIDEWGAWYDAEPGDHPGFNFQQNTMRDAMVAAWNLNLFNHHCDRVKMANIAQMVNVLQSVILTEGERMIKTPTYHVFEMFKHHQEAELLYSQMVCGSLETSLGALEQVTQSASVNEKGEIHLTIANISADASCPVEIDFGKKEILLAEGEILTGDIHDKNTFQNPEAVKKVSYDGVKEEKGVLFMEMPSCSLVHLTVKVQD